MKFVRRSALGAVLLSALPSVAAACSACILADPKTSGTYLKMTLIMSALPLGLLAGVTYWLWRRYSPRAKAAGAATRPLQLRPDERLLERHGA